MTNQENDIVAHPYDWMDEARAMAAQCWCDDETEHIVMDTTLAEAIAWRIAAWMQTGALHASNETYWRKRAEEAEAELSSIKASQDEPVAFAVKGFQLQWNPKRNLDALDFTGKQPLYLHPSPTPQGWRKLLQEIVDLAEVGDADQDLTGWHPLLEDARKAPQESAQGGGVTDKSREAFTEWLATQPKGWLTHEVWDAACQWQRERDVEICNATKDPDIIHYYNKACEKCAAAIMENDQ
jgi:hypothetical protein